MRKMINEKVRLCIVLIFFAFVPSLANGITLVWSKHNAQNIISTFSIKKLGIRKSTIGNRLIELLNRVETSKYFENFSIQFVRTNIYSDPIVVIADESTPSINEQKTEFAGLFIAKEHFNYYVKEDSDMLWKQCFSSTGTEDSIKIHQKNVPDTVYITYPDVRTVCVALIGEKESKTIYLEIDGNVEEEDATFIEFLRRK